MKTFWQWLKAQLPLTCAFGCASPVVGIYWLDQGCACFPKRRLQCLCGQHLLRSNPHGEMRPLLKIHPMPSFGGLPTQ